MKKSRTFRAVFLVLLVGLLGFNGCGGGGGGIGGFGGSGGSGDSSTQAPSSIIDFKLIETVTSSEVISGSGTIIEPGETITYSFIDETTILGEGLNTLPTEFWSYTYAGNEAEVTLDYGISGNSIESLTFLTPTSGTFISIATTPFTTARIEGTFEIMSLSLNQESVFLVASENKTILGTSAFKQYEYDENRHLIRESNTGVEPWVKTYEYNNDNLIKEVQSNEGEINYTTVFTYDISNNLLVSISNGGFGVDKYLYTYDENNNVTSKVRYLNDTQSEMKRYTYDNSNKLLTETSFNNSEEVIQDIRYVYNDENKMIEYAYYDSSGDLDFKWEFSYDLNGFLIKKTNTRDSIISETIYINDINGNPISSIFYNNGIQSGTGSFIYDTYGNLLKETSRSASGNITYEATYTYIEILL